MKICILLFEGFTALDVIGPYEVFSRIKEATLYFVAKEKRVYHDIHGLGLQARYSLNEFSNVDLLLIPGGPGIDKILSDTTIRTWIQEMNNHSRWTVSVCSGALLLAEAGLLSGKNCTTHWKRREQLRKYNVILKEGRYVQDGKIITSAGVSAGIDMAFFLVSKLTSVQEAKKIQLSMEYDPTPLFDYNSLLRDNE